MSKKTVRKAETSADAYRVNVGLNYGPDDRRAEPGDIVTDLPEASIGWLLARGYVTAVAADVEGDN